MTGPALPPFPKGVGVCELVPADILVTPDHAYLAVSLEMIDGDGVRVLVDLPAALDLALRVSVAVARLRRLTP